MIIMCCTGKSVPVSAKIACLSTLAMDEKRESAFLPFSIAKFACKSLRRDIRSFIALSHKFIILGLPSTQQGSF